MTLQTPVPDDFFHPPPLSPDKIEELRAIGHRAKHDVLEYSKLTGGPVEWTLITNDAKTQVYSAREGNLPLFLGTTEIETTLDETRAIFIAPTTADARRVNAAYLPDVLDEVRLYTLSAPTEDRPHHFSFVSWILHRSPFQGRIVRHRDLCAVQHLEDVEIDGKKAWLEAYKSVVLPACPDFEKKHGVIRAEFVHFGVIYMETDKPGILRVYHLEHVDPHGQVSGDMIGNILMYKMTEGQYIAMNAMQNNVYAHRLSHVSYLASASYVNKNSRSKCAVCLKKFGTFTRKSNCRRCGEVVCSKVCSAKYKVMMANILVELRVCSRCIPGPNEIDYETTLSTLNKSQHDGLSVSSQSSNPSFVKGSHPLEKLSRMTEPITLSSYSSDDMYTMSGMERNMILLDLDGPSFAMERDPGGHQTSTYSESSKGSSPRRRGDMVLLD
ncbi:hypothetical protein LEN26_004858 [Aphanomyces euteiches]|nr:hypothetical protein AeMF1_018748 [Aphanomyces euteiches]KAH9118286.1 hypothetical protein AeMF1_008454 [Aphanomyces euteiches]KAH9146937.1 hypothetical protein LEN26_004858 [Aphanomyces euteiches]KAH9184153.1 hypothetical protein AeNC1_013873 [Aphanomyces euteiches]